MLDVEVIDVEVRMVHWARNDWRLVVTRVIALTEFFLAQEHLGHETVRDDSDLQIFCFLRGN
jgi:hypothetical protein